MGSSRSEHNIVSQSHAGELPTHRRRKEIPVAPTDVTARSHTGTAAQDELSRHEFAVVLAYRTRGRAKAVLTRARSVAHQIAPTLSTEVAELERTLTALQASGSSDQAAIQNAQARLAALSILIGTVGATGPGVTVRIEDPGPGVAPQAMLDVLDELRAAGAEAIQIGDGHQAVRAGVDTWIVGAPGTLTVDGKILMPPYSVLAIGDPPTLAAAMNIPGGAVDSVKRVGGTMSVQQGDKVDITALRQPKPRQYAQPGK